MKKFLNESDKKNIISEKEKMIIESFAKTFNKIKRIDESKLNENSNDYYETLSQTLDAVRDYAAKLGYELDEDEIFSKFGTGGISYETYKSANIPLLKNGEPILNKSGKEMNRAIHVSIYRMPSGKYELTMYKTY